MTESSLKNRWRSFRFDRMASMINDRIDNPQEAGVHRYVGLEHLDPHSLRIGRWGSPSDVTATKLLFRAGDIIFGRRRVYQRKLAVADFDGICSAHAMVLRAKPGVVLPEFLPFFMQSDIFMERAKEISVGSLSPTINWKSLAKEEFALPPLDEQIRIVRLLQAAHLAAETLRGALNALLTCRLSAIHEFERRVDKRQMTTLASIPVDLEAGQSPSSPGRPAQSSEPGVLKVSAVGDWAYFADENKVINDFAFHPHLEVKVGDLLATRANADPSAVGRTCLVSTTRPRLMLSDKTWRMTVTSDSPYPLLGILAWTKSRSFRIHVRNHLSGTDAKNISQANFLRGPIPVWSKEFAAFSERVAEITAGLSAVESRLEMTGTLISSIQRSEMRR